MPRTRPKPSSVEAQDRSAEAAREIGRALREARQARGEELQEIADYLRIRPAYVEALEAGELDRIPGRPYVVGFLRSYSTYLGLDGERLVGRLKGTIDKVAARPELNVREPIAAESRRGTAVMVAASLLLAAGVYTGYYVIYHVDRGGAGPAVGEAPGDVARLAAETLRRGDAARVEREAAPPPVVVAVAPPPDRRIESLSARDGEAAAGPRADASSAVAGETASPPRAIAPGEAGAAPAPARELLAALESDRVNAAARPSGANAGDPNGRLTLVAAEGAWIQVRSAGRDYVRTRTLAPGERFTLPNRSDLALWTGDAGALEVLVDGQSRGRLGQPGEVVKGVPLAADQLRARPAAPAR
jgi:cytoskeleton protein RodZ